MNDDNHKAEWHLAALSSSNEGGDPFGAAFYTRGIVVGLNATEDELADICVTLMRKEERLFNRGITCPYKDAGQDCVTCPHATLDVEDRRSFLCRLGKDQSVLEGRYFDLVNQRQSGCDDLAAEVDAASELGHLPDDLAELLTAVGL